MILNDLTLEATDMSINRDVGFVKVTNLGKAQQTTIDANKLIQITKLLSNLEKMGFAEVTLTVQKGKPLIIGGKVIGIAIASLE